MAKRNRVPSVQEAVEQLIDALNDDGQLPPSLRHQLRHGLELREAHRFGDLDVMIASSRDENSIAARMVVLSRTLSRCSRELAVLRAQRKRAENERHNRRRELELIAKDARIEGRFADALLILTEVMDRDEALERLAS